MHGDYVSMVLFAGTKYQSNAWYSQFSEINSQHVVLICWTRAHTHTVIFFLSSYFAWHFTNAIIVSSIPVSFS